jgi:hypothetical protein
MRTNGAGFSASDDAANVSVNAYNNGGWKFKGTSIYRSSLYSQFNGSHYWHIGNTGTAGNAISFTQALTLNTNGALVLQGGDTAASGVGIAFPATQSASSNANTLDDYEEGTWTPTIAAGYTGVTYNTQNGRYTKVGRLVTLTCYLQFSGTFDASSISVGSLPFDLAAVTAGNCGTVGYWDVTTDGNLSAYIATSTTVVFYKIGTSSSAISIGNVTEKYIVFSMTGSI